MILKRSIKIFDAKSLEIIDKEFYDNMISL